MIYKIILSRILLLNILTIIIYSSSIAQTMPIVAEINGKKIKLETIIHAINELPQEIQSQPFLNYYEELLERVIDINLLAQAAKNDNLQNEANIKSAIEFITNKVLMQAYLSKLVSLSISEKDIQKAYDNYLADITSREEIKASHILLENKKEAQDIIRRLENGENFIQLAKEFSKGPSGPSGGDLGWFSRGQMVPGFESVAFSLENNQVTNIPVQTQFGWHVIKLNDRRVPEAPDYESLKMQLAQDIERQIVSKKVQELRESSSINRMPAKELEPFLNIQNN